MSFNIMYNNVKSMQLHAAVSNYYTTSARTQMKMLFNVQNERITFEIYSESAIAGSTLE